MALNKAVRISGAARLHHGKNDYEGLFNKTGRDQKAISHAIDLMLWEEEKRSATNVPKSIRLLPAGLRRLIERSGNATRIKLIQSASPLYQQQLLKYWSDLAAANRWEKDFPKIAQCCVELIVNIEKLLPVEERQSKSRLTTPMIKKPSLSSDSQNNDEADFKRRMAKELVIAWKYAPNRDAKKGIANALKNAGIEQIGDLDEVVPMDGSRHFCDGPAFPGDEVKIDQCGWLVHDGVGEFLLEKAIVKMI